MIRTASLLPSVIVALLAASEATEAADAPGDAQHVVIVHGSDFFLPASLESDRALRAALVSSVDGPIAFHAEPLNAMESMQVPNDDVKSKELREKYGSAHVDLVVAVSSVALRFVQRHRADIWPGAPVVYYNVADHAIAGEEFPPDIGGISLPFDIAGTLALAVKLQPHARRLVYVAGVAPYDNIWLPMVRRAIDPYRDRLEVIEKTGVSIPILQRELGRLPSDTIVLYSSMFRDADGGGYAPKDSAQALAKSLSAPLYAFHGSYMGSGVLGGSMVDYAANGRDAGLLAAQVLNGELAGLPPQVRRSTSVAHCTVDLRQMRRWKLPMRSLPENCSVLFAELSMWQAYRSVFILGAVALIALSALAVALALQRRRRQLAEGEASERRAEVAHAARLALVGEITASVVHEVTQPLSAILSNADAARMLLDKADPSLDEVKQILTDIRSDDLRAYEVVRRLRQLLKKRALQTERVDLNQIAASVLDLTRPDAVRREVRVRSQLDPALPRVSGDPVQLQQVLLNLVINAMDAMKAIPVQERVLDVCTSLRDTRFATVTVIDSGLGIDPQELPRLFESFFTTKHDGMGLGLSVARTIVEAHGGMIWAENNTAGGAAFRFTVPLSVA